MERPFIIAAAVVVLAHGCGGRTITAGPAGEQAVGGGGGEGGAGAHIDAATSVASVGGSGGQSVGEGGSGQGSGAGPPNPLDCINCVAMNCPDAVACFTDPECMQGLVCSVTQCLNSGQPDLMCVTDCFNGDLAKALEALQALGCIFMSCQDECGGLLPGP